MRKIRGRTVQYCVKPFDELNREEMWHMRRNLSYFRIRYEDFLKFYNVTPIEYADKITEVGLVLQRDEREAAAKIKREQRKKEHGPRFILTRREMMASRIFRGYSRFDMSRKTGIHESILKEYERGKKEIPIRVQQFYMDVLRIRPNELKRIRLALDGKVEKVEGERVIPQRIKDDVYKRDKGACTKCGRRNNLHYHHIKRFSDGGLHSINNIKLLCAPCHAKEHKGEPGYHLLKSIVERMMAGDSVG